LINRFIDNARSGQRQCVQNPPEAAIDLKASAASQHWFSIVEIVTGPTQVDPGG
jgi:hypothetical protein